MKLERYCTCGQVLRIDIPRRKEAQALSVWRAQHMGEGHEPTNASGAEAARMGTDTGIGRETAKYRRRS